MDISSVSDFSMGDWGGGPNKLWCILQYYNGSSPFLDFRVSNITTN